MSLPPHGDWLHRQLPPGAPWNKTTFAVPGDRRMCLRWAEVPVGDRTDWGGRLFDGERCYIGTFSGRYFESQQFSVGKRYLCCGQSDWFNCTWLLAVLRAEEQENPSGEHLWESVSLASWVHWRHGPDAEGIWQQWLSITAKDRAARQDFTFDGCTTRIDWSHHESEG